MRGLTGDFETMPLKDLALHLGNRRATGLLSFERPGIRKAVAIREGKAVSASSTEPREYLGQFLINLGHLDEAQLHKAFQTQQETRVLLGKIVTMIGLVSEQAATGALLLKIRESLLEAFRWTEGTFHFDAGAELPAQDGLEVEVDLLEVHREGEFRETAWEAIRAAFPSGGLTLRATDGLPAPAPGSMDERLLSLIGAGSTIDEMILSLHATDFFVYQRLYALYRQDAIAVAEQVEVELEDPPEALGLGDEPTADELLQHVTTFLSTGNFLDAEALARRAVELSPGPQATELLRQAEAGLLRQLRAELLNGGRVPALTVAPARLRELPMSAPERYLLSRIDGAREVGAIVQVSPLRELDALKFFQRFLESGLIELRLR